MLIEKAIGIYDADGLKSKLDEVNCHYCGEIITRSAYEPGRYNSYVFYLNYLNFKSI